ncbi:hypothetical protein BABINDRAFT_159414 [Babjeviella inositovora NRRL Y-12698]|uniref:MOSC domain-containing protein n=1 Tax=Babjeviella inositovora NRRL Y-12698 TaxID=984486 RepID=A0A1E3QZ26_9ASCO|nr:uncharacterized protein BABINDRAFT_159414 [Babjeviella inositovora NRRL Y-12698]ODQ82929.1 hypothetical protein BABINDRAFT_159414 [Babjeviella inositovora NRRL Y-12698]
MMSIADLCKLLVTVSLVFVSSLYFLPSVLSKIAYTFFPQTAGGSKPTPKQHQTYEYVAKFLNFFYWLQEVVLPAQLLGEDGGLVSKIFVYPIKSCGSIAVDKWVVNEHGLAYDRQYMLVYKKKNSGPESALVTLSHTLCPMLTSLVTKFIPGKSDETYFTEALFEFSYPAAEGLHAAGSFTLPVHVTDEYIKVHAELKSPILHNLYGVGFTAHSLVNVLPRAFIENLKLPESTTLIYSKTGKFVKTKSPSPEVFLQKTPREEGNAFRKTLFSDYYPALVFSQRDVDYANKCIEANTDVVAPVPKVTAYTFRGNILVSGGRSSRPHDNDTWAKFTINLKTTGVKHLWYVAMKCARCSSLNIVQGKLNPKLPVSRALAKYRKVESSKELFFGIYCIQDDFGYEINTGDSITILGRKISSAAPLE